MDVEETPHGAALNSNGSRPKRPKTDYSDAKLQEQLLQRNSFATLAKQPNNQPSATVTTSSDNPGKEKLPPLVVKNAPFATVYEKMLLCEAKPVFKITRFGTKLNCSSSEDFTKVQNHLQRCGLEYYTHDQPSARPYRVVLRGLPLTDPNDLLERLKCLNIDATAAYVIRRRGETAAEDESFYLLHFPKGYTDLKRLREIKYVSRISVRWDSYRSKRADVTQCTNCLHHGHGTRNCHLKPRCNNCAGNHDTGNCPSKEGEKRCANCSGTHQATDRSCPKRAEYLNIRRQATTKNQPGRKAPKSEPPVPVMTTHNFPPLPKIPAPAGTSTPVGRPLAAKPEPNQQRRLDPRLRAATNAPTPPPPPSDPSPDETSKPLFSSAECWAIFTEFSARLKQCKTRAEQVDVIGYMVCYYGVN